MGFPSPATDYVEQRLSVNSICNVGPNTLLFERSGGYVVLDISLKPKQGSQVLIQHGGGTELATLRGKSLITEEGEATAWRFNNERMVRTVTTTSMSAVMVRYIAD
ncbi:hypothetical protein ACUB3A_004612 [Klebsiella pneumoniae]|uniref:hypothetical protein n=1 Tax=Klebsiella pneumoniae TaxID=573 RepID=UPI00333B27D9